MIVMAPVALGSLTFGAFEVTGHNTLLNLIAAGTNALNGALLARRPDHYHRFTVVGILLMALLGGIGGGVTRDVMLGKVPAALTNPSYIVLCLAAGYVGHRLAYAKGQLFREGLFQFATSLSLPWYAVVGAQAGSDAGVPILGCILLAIIGPTAGRYLIDVSCGVPPKHFVQGEWFVSAAALTGAVWLAVDATGAGAVTNALVAVVVGFFFRVAALYRGWEEPLADEPAGIVEHDDGRPLLGRKLSGKSQRELRALGLVPDDDRAPGSEVRR